MGTYLMDIIFLFRDRQRAAKKLRLYNPYVEFFYWSAVRRFNSH